MPPVASYPEPVPSGPRRKFDQLSRIVSKWVRRWRVELRIPIALSVSLVGSAAAAVIAYLAWRAPVGGVPVERSLPRFSLPMPAREVPVGPATGLRASPAPVARVPSTTTALVIHVAGAVRRPGVHRVPVGARVDDAVRAAGGASAAANLDAVNLAAPVADGSRVYVPTKGQTSAPVVFEPSPATPAPAASGSSSASSAGPAAGPVDLNTASVEQLDTLPGVGPATAAAVIEYRTQHGRFRSVTELLEVRGIGDAKLAAMRSRVRV